MSDDGGVDPATWLLIEGNRHLVAALFVLGVLVVIVGLVQVGVVAVGPASTVRSLLSSGVTSGLLALITVSLSINQLLLSRVFGSPGSLQDRMEGTVEFRDRIEDVAGVSAAPNDPVEFLGLHGDLLAERCDRLAEADVGDEVAAFCESAGDYADDLVALREGEADSLDALVTVLGSEYADLLVAARRLEDDAAGLPSDAETALEEVETLLRSVGVVRQFFKTIAIQQDLAQLSRMIAYTGLVVLTATYALALVYTLPASATLPTPVLVWVTPAGLAATTVPLALLISYIVRVATISRYTVSVGPFVPPEERFE